MGIQWPFFGSDKVCFQRQLSLLCLEICLSCRKIEVRCKCMCMITIIFAVILSINDSVQVSSYQITFVFLM